MRTAFNIANKATPTSAITASHKVAIPPAPNVLPNYASCDFTDLNRCNNFGGLVILNNYICSFN